MPQHAAGIYAITNSRTGEQYIGSAVQIGKRWREHIGALEHNRHHSWRLQRAAAKDGLEAFAFSVLEYVENLDELIAREQFYLDTRFAAKGSHEYNICPIAGNTRGVERHAEWRRSISAAKKGKHKGIPWSPARRAAQPKRSGETLTDAQRAAYEARSQRPRTERELARDERLRGQPLTEERWASIRKASAVSHAKPRTEKQRATARANLEKARATPLSQAQLDALARGRLNGAGHQWSEEERVNAKTRPRPPATEKQRAALDAGRERINRLGLNVRYGPRTRRPAGATHTAAFSEETISHVLAEMDDDDDDRDDDRPSRN